MADRPRWPTGPNDHYGIVRGFIWEFGQDDPVIVAALDALVAELDTANAEWHRLRDLHADAISEVTRLREALRQIVGLSENNDEMSSHQRFDGIHRIARAALGEDTP